MSDVLGFAIRWHQAGACVIRTTTDGYKRPLGEWKQYQTERPPLAQVVNWFSSGHPGIGLIMGAVSGNLELLEFEGRAVEAGLVERFTELAAGSGLGPVWTELMSGYVEDTPSGGMHFIYRVTGGTAHGNTKLARTAVKLPLIETRGEGGFCVVAPSSGPVHPTGKPWVAVASEPGHVLEITAEQRDALFNIARTFDASKPDTGKDEEGFFVTSRKSQVSALSPGDDYENQTSWNAILTPHDWTWVFTQPPTQYWRRPGKDIGISATTGNAEDRDRLYVFSTSTPFEAEKPYTKFAAYAVLNHGGDYSAAARELATLGYGSRQDKEYGESHSPKQQNDEAVALRVAKTRKASEYGMRNPRWLWATENGEYGRIPLNALTLMAGKAGVGKTTLECTMAAWITTGTMKGQYWGEPKHVLFVPYEDDIEESINPHLAAAGANLDMVHFITMEQLGRAGEDDVLLPVDCEVIAQKAIELGAVAIFVDPLSAALHVDNANDQKKVRRAAQAVQQMARKYQIAVIGIVHTRKAVTTTLLDAVMGSSELGNVSRAAIGLMRDNDMPGTVIMSQEKVSNSRLDIPGYRYKIEPCDVEHEGQRVRSSSMVFIEKVEPQAVTAMLERQAVSPGQGRSVTEDAKQFIMEYLVDHGGSATRAEVLKAAGKEMLTASRATLDNAAAALGVKSGTNRKWEVPARGFPLGEGASSSRRTTLSDGE